MILGVAGKACSGKNAICALLEERGFYSIDVDRLGHKVLDSQRDQLVSLFGDKILSLGGALDRAALGALVFSDREKLRLLESVVHPAVIEETKLLITSHRNENIIVNAAILGQVGMDLLTDRVIWVDAPPLLRFIRAFRRDGGRIKHIIRRIRAQRDLNIQHFSHGVDIYRIRNGGSLKTLKKSLEKFLGSFDEWKRV